MTADKARTLPIGDVPSGPAFHTIPEMRPSCYPASTSSILRSRCFCRHMSPSPFPPKARGYYFFSLLATSSASASMSSALSLVKGRGMSWGQSTHSRVG